MLFFLGFVLLIGLFVGGIFCVLMSPGLFQLYRCWKTAKQRRRETELDAIAPIDTSNDQWPPPPSNAAGQSL